MSAAEPPPGPALAAVVLTGGSGVRLGGVDKASLTLGGRSLLEHAIAATAPAGQVVVVGPEQPTSRGVTWTREEPPGGGPAAGLLAGLDALPRPTDAVLALAVDMPRVTPGTVARLLSTLEATGPACDGVALVDATGHLQPLAAVYRYDALQRARPATRAEEHGMSLRRLLRDLSITPVPATAEESRDVDTWDDLDALDR